MSLLVSGFIFILLIPFSKSQDTCPPVLDLAILFDSSGGTPNVFEQQKNWTIGIVRELPIHQDAVRITLLQYAEEVKTEFNLSRFSERNDMIKYFDEISLLRGNTKSGGALRQAEEELFDYENGARLNANRMVIIFTDGLSMDNPVSHAKSLRRRGVKIIAISVNSIGFVPGMLGIVADSDNIYGPNDEDRLLERLLNEVEKSRSCEVQPRKQSKTTSSFTRARVTETPESVEDSEDDIDFINDITPTEVTVKPVSALLSPVRHNDNNPVAAELDLLGNETAKLLKEIEDEKNGLARNLETTTFSTTVTTMKATATTSPATTTTPATESKATQSQNLARGLASSSTQGLNTIQVHNTTPPSFLSRWRTSSQTPNKTEVITTTSKILSTQPFTSTQKSSTIKEVSKTSTVGTFQKLSTISTTSTPTTTTTTTTTRSLTSTRSPVLTQKTSTTLSTVSLPSTTQTVRTTPEPTKTPATTTTTNQRTRSFFNTRVTYRPLSSVATLPSTTETKSTATIPVVTTPITTTSKKWTPTGVFRHTLASVTAFPTLLAMEKSVTLPINADTNSNNNDNSIVDEAKQKKKIRRIIKRRRNIPSNSEHEKITDSVIEIIPTTPTSSFKFTRNTFKPEIIEEEEIVQPGVQCPMDVLFVVDSSGSIAQTYETQKDFLTNLIKRVEPSRSHRVGLIQFAGPHLQKMEWSFDTHSKNSQLLSAIRSVRHLTGTTYIGAALELSLILLDSRRKHTDTTVILVSDGFSQDDSTQQAKLLRQLPNVNMYAISMNTLTNTKHLTDIVGDRKNVFINEESKWFEEFFTRKLKCVPTYR